MVHYSLHFSTLLVLSLVCTLLSATAGPADPQELPEGCEVEVEDVIICNWNFVLDVDGIFEADLSWVTTAVMTLRITPANPDSYAWAVYGYEEDELLQWEGFQTGETSGVYFLEFDTDGKYEFSVYHNYYTGIPTEYDVELVFDIKEGQERPDVPAGSPEDPQLIDSGGDSSPRHMDITGAWFDQPYLDDGMIEVGLVVPYLHEAGVDEDEVLAWNLRWNLLGHSYEVRWSHFNESNPFGMTDAINFHEWQAQLTEDDEFKSRLFPTVGLENGTLTARIPLSTIGDPQEGVRFKNLSASSLSGKLFTGISQPGTSFYIQNPTAQDHDLADEVQRLFAVGGPDVWGELRGIEPQDDDPEEELSVSWYANPLAPENLPDTFQILGGVLGALAFLAGAVFVRRRRKRLARLFEEVENTVREHRDDPDAALEALDALESRFDSMLESGRLQDHQHAALLTKIERVGYRLVRKARPATE